jgi:anti-sigma factor ChrR (cupin superfamily)
VSAASDHNDCPHAERVAALAVHALPAAEAAGVEQHVRSCAACARDLERLRPVVDSFAAWPTDVVRPRASLQERLARRIAAETDGRVTFPPAAQWREPDWKEVAPGISCKLLATDSQRDIVSMLVRLAPGAHYPAHTHSGVEELHLLDGELWIEERKLYPGDYNRGEPGTGDKLVWSETGCTCVLITSTKDVLA